MQKLDNNDDYDYKCEDCGDKVHENPDGTLPMCSCDTLMGGGL